MNITTLFKFLGAPLNNPAGHGAQFALMARWYFGFGLKPSSTLTVQNTFRCLAATGRTSPSGLRVATSVSTNAGRIFNYLNAEPLAS